MILFNKHNLKYKISYAIIFILLTSFMLAVPVITKAEDDIIEVDNQTDLQSALNGDVPVIKIISQDGKFNLSKALTIDINRTVTLMSDNPVSLIGAGNQWQIITGIGKTINIKFENVALDGNNSSGGIYNRGSLTLENAAIKNCNHSNGGSGIYSTGNLTISNGTFTNNKATNQSYIDGGSIYANGTSSRLTVNITNSKITGSNSRYGGGIRIDNADAAITNCEFSGNTAAQGAGIYFADSNAKLTNCLLTKNTGSGGAVFANNSAVTISDSTVSDNNGRGIYGYAYIGNVDITIKGKSIISGNSVPTSYGGGIIGYSEAGGKVTINIEGNSEIIDNEASYGGGISGYSGSTVEFNISGNVRIANNTASKDGGGIWTSDLNMLNLNGVKFENNKSSQGYFWRLNSPADSNQTTDASIHNQKIQNTLYSAPYTNAYNNHDVNYKTSAVLTPYTVTYNGNGNDEGSVPAVDPYLPDETAVIQTPPGLLKKTGYYFAGWNTEPDGTGSNFVYDNATGLFSPSDIIIGTSNVILYAQWHNVEVIEPVPSVTAEPSPSASSTATTTYTPAPIWTYYYLPPEPPPGHELIPLDDGTVELIDDTGTPLGVWSKDSEGDWVYEDYSEKTNVLLIISLAFLGLAALAALIYYLIITRRHITRRKFVYLIAEAIDLDAEIINTEPYDDVSENEKYYDPIMKAKSSGLLSGFSDSEFKPRSFITREEMASILSEAVLYKNSGIPVRNIDLSSMFNDFDSINENFTADIELVIQLGIMQEKSDNIFDPNGLSTKLQVLNIIKNLLESISLNTSDPDSDV